MPTTTIHLTWPANPADELVTSYQVHQSVDNGASYQLLAEVTTNSFDIVNPNPGRYLWAVKSHNLGGWSPLGAAAVGPNIPSTPPAPTISVTVS